MTTFTTGRLAEKAAADYLRSKGYTILDQNWRTAWCEVDIVAVYKGVVYICEVKYRETTYQGGGIEYITPKKLRQLERAADSWVALHSWNGEYQLAALEVSGPDFAVTTFVTEF
ncbi:MAG TPA: YraN family protein [Candidatus Saccharimonadales bacterium]|nr:YraN family protein [Candidatus Saccharimonadales bacterium]